MVSNRHIYCFGMTLAALLMGCAQVQPTYRGTSDADVEDARRQTDTNRLPPIGDSGPDVLVDASDVADGGPDRDAVLDDSSDDASDGLDVGSSDTGDRGGADDGGGVDDGGGTEDGGGFDDGGGLDSADAEPRCDETGETPGALECGPGATCVSGVCHPHICSPGTTHCEGDVVAACSDDGLAVSRTDCRDTDEVCEAGACVCGEACAVDPCDRCGSCGTLDCWLWYQPSNGRVGGGVLHDFEDVFRRPELWEEARSHNGVMFLRSSSIRHGIDDRFIEEELVPRLVDWDMRIGLDVVGATWASCREDRSAGLNQDLALIDQIVGAGGRVEFVALQSILSKPVSDNPGFRVHCPPYTEAMRIDDVVWYIEEASARYPDIEFGIIDALLAHGEDPRGPYSRLTAALADRDLTLDFVLLDHPYHHGETAGITSWEWVKRVEDHVRDTLGVGFGLLYISSTGGHASDEAFYTDVMDGYAHYRAAGGRPDYLVVASWFVHPSDELPEDATAPVFPLTRVLRDLARRVVADNTAPTGRFGSISDAGRASGWALDPDNPLVSIRVAFFADGPRGSGEPLGEVVADVPRPDVTTATGYSGDHGFRFDLPESLRDGAPHDIYGYGIDSRDMGAPALLNGAPMTVTWSP